MPARDSAMEVERPAKGNARASTRVQHARIEKERRDVRRVISEKVKGTRASRPAIYLARSHAQPTVDDVRRERERESGRKREGTAAKETRTGKHVLRWCIRHHKTGALDFTACRARIRVRTRACTRTSSDKINFTARRRERTSRDGRCDYARGHACNARLRLFYYRYLFAAAMSRGCPASSPRRNKIRDIYEPPNPPDFENVSQRVSLSLSSSFFPGARGRSFIYRRRGALCAAARGIFENNLWPRPQTSRLRCGERPASSKSRSLNSITMRY